LKNGLARAIAFCKKHWIVIRSWLLFAATLGIWLLWYPTIVDTKVLSGFLEFTARITGVVLGVFGAHPDITGAVISSGDFSMRIGHECTAIVPSVILLCAVIAYPSRIRDKLVCLAIGLPALFILNMMRVITLYYIGNYIPTYFDIAHYVVWQSVMILAVIILWLVWVGKVVNARRQA
jgi:exosortase H (IPTLxxWG-CTERM-specific)